MLKLYIIDCDNKHVIYYYVIVLCYVLFDKLPFHKTYIINQPSHNSPM